MNTVIQDNVNPIEKLERSMLILATSIQGKPSEDLVKLEHRKKIETFSPKLFDSQSFSTVSLIASGKGKDKGKEKEKVLAK